MKFLNIIKSKTALFALFAAILLGASFATLSGFAAPTVPMEGDVTSLNASKGETEYGESTDLMVDEVAQIQLWHHNLKAPNTDVATNTVVKFEVPTEAGDTQVIRGVSSSDNGNTISDTTTINLSLDKAKLRYEVGSAKFKYNKGAADGRAECITGYDYPAESCFALVPLPDSIITTGVNLDDYRGGPLKGCNAYHEAVIIQVRSVATSLKVNKYVRHLGETSEDWKTHMNAEPGDDLEYMIRFENKGNLQLEDVTVGDNLPRYHDYIEGSTKLMNGTYPNGTSISSDNIITGGIFVGDYNPGAVGYVLIQTKINPVTAFEYCGDYELTNTALVGADNNNTVYNTTKVTVNVDGSNCDEEPEMCPIPGKEHLPKDDPNCKEEPEEPIYSCDSLNIFKVDRDTYRFTVNATASNGATIESYAVNTGTEVISSDSNVIEYTYAQAGNYDITATVNVNVDGETKAVTSNNCKGQVKVDQPEEPVYECVAVKASLIADNTFRFNTITRVDGGASVKHYVYNFGDGNEATVSENVIEHKYAKAGEYNVSVTVVFNVNDELRSVECGVKVTIDEEVENCPVPGKGHLPADSDDCYENCPIEGFTHLPKDDARCKDKQTPTVLPNTGAGSFIGLALATTMFGAFTHRFALLRK